MPLEAFFLLALSCRVPSTLARDYFRPSRFSALYERAPTRFYLPKIKKSISENQSHDGQKIQIFLTLESSPVQYCSVSSNWYYRLTMVSSTTRYMLLLLIPLCYSIFYAEWSSKYLLDFSYESSQTTTRAKNEISERDTDPPTTKTNATIYSNSTDPSFVQDNDWVKSTNDTSEIAALDSSFEVSHPTKEPVLTLLVMLNGEFGNHMGNIIRAWGVAKNAERRFGLTTRLVFHQQIIRGSVSGKAAPTARQLKECILRPTYIRAGDFALGKRLVDEGYFYELPREVFQPDQFDLQTVVDYLSDHPELIQEEMTSNSTIVENGTKVPRLMIRVQYINIFSVVDKFYDDLLKTFVFDDEICCGKTLDEPPEDDETILHLRNFATELRRESLRKARGFEQLDKDRIASELLGHLKEGDKIALAGRNLQRDAADNSTEAYGIVESIKAKNMTVRFSPGTSGMNDFCFLKSARKELIGTSTSTYTVLASIMAGPSLKRATLYQYVADELVEDARDLTTFHNEVGTNWTHPELQSRIQFKEYFPITNATQEGA